MHIQVLIVEDEPNIALLYKSKFEIEGQRVLTANNGKEALKILNTEKPDVVLADILMPELDGLKMLEAMRLNKNQTPVIMLTNVGQDDYVRKALALGAKDYLVKSDATPEMVYEKILKVIKQ